jgi:hypothetical protein
MAIADDLLTLAGQLSTPVPADPEQAWLRRSVSIRELIAAMIQTSDNTATNRCIAMVGMDQINRTLVLPFPRSIDRGRTEAI